jgi:hypothetical protein
VLAREVDRRSSVGVERLGHRGAIEHMLAELLERVVIGVFIALTDERQHGETQRHRCVANKTCWNMVVLPSGRSGRDIDIGLS